MMQPQVAQQMQEQDSPRTPEQMRLDEQWLLWLRLLMQVQGPQQQQDTQQLRQQQMQQQMQEQGQPQHGMPQMQGQRLPGLARRRYEGSDALVPCDQGTNVRRVRARHTR